MKAMAADRAEASSAKGITRREAEILSAVQQRLSNAEIAGRLFVSERTVESHVAALLRKLGGRSRRDLFEKATALAEAVRPLPPQLTVLTETGPFVGRDRELASLVDWLMPAMSAGPRAALVTGEAGIGKSRLVAELALVAHGTGATVLLGQCFEDLARPYEPVVQAIAADLCVLPDAEARRRLGSDGPPLARLVPAVQDRFGDLARDHSGGAASDRTGLHEAVSRYLARASQSAPVLLVLEDVHWAPLGTIELIRHVARTAVGRVLMVVTARDSPPESTQELAESLALFQRLPLVRRVGLSGLDRAGVQALVESVRAPAPGIIRDRFVAVVLDQTAGNPLFARELAHALDDRLVYTGPLPVPVGLRDLLASRFARLSRDDQPLLDVAAVIGTEFDLPVLAASAGVSLLEAIDVLERAEEAGLVVAVPERPGRFAFAHALVRSARYDTLTVSSRIRLHLAVAVALEQQPDADVAQLARHWCAAAPLGHAERGVRYARLAAERARASVALAEAAHHYEAALHAGSLLPHPDPELRCDLLTGYGEVLHRIGDPRYTGTLADAAALAEGLDQERLARVVFALNEHGWASLIGTLDDTVIRLAERALRGVGTAPSATRARLLAILASEFHLTQHDEERHPLIREALAIARALGDPRVLGEVLVSHHWAGLDPDNLSERLAMAEEMISLGETLGDRTLVLQGHACRYSDSIESGRVEVADGELDVMERMATQLELPFFVVRVLRARAQRAAYAGRFDEADRYRQEILDVGRAAGLGYAPTVGSHVAAVVDMDRGPRPETLEELERVAAQPSGFRLPQALLAELSGAAGNYDEARARVASLGRHGFSDIPRNVSWLATISFCGHVAALTRDQCASRVLYRLLAPYSGRIGWSGLPAYSVDLVLGCLAASLGEREPALRHLDSAQKLAARMGAVTHAARVRLYRVASTGDDPDGTAHPARAAAVAGLEAMTAIGAQAVWREAELLGITG
ncbi:MAG: AAA family ATPase [Acidimicrobiia bacterium]